MEINNCSFTYKTIASELIITTQEWDPAVTIDNAMKTAQSSVQIKTVKLLGITRKRINNKKANKQAST